MGQLFLVIGLVFSPIAAAMAFLITYEEWSHHGLSRGELLKRSGQMAGVALLFFLALSLAAGLGFLVLEGRG